MTPAWTDPVYPLPRPYWQRLARLLLCDWLQCHRPSSQQFTRPGYYFLAPCLRCAGMHGWRKGRRPRWIANVEARLWGERLR